MSRIYNRYRQRNVTEESAADIDRRHRDAVNAIVQKPDTEVTDPVVGPPLVTIDSLRVHYGRGNAPIRAVDDVSFAIGRGECVGLVGESGCGKSTLARAILGLEAITGGEVSFDGRRVPGLDDSGWRSIRRQAQMIFQDPYGSLNPRKTIGAAIAEVLAVHKRGTRTERKGLVSGLLESVGLEPAYANRYPHEFSGGQRQRVGIARALAVDPVFLIADEPVSALDVSVQVQVLNLLKDLQRDRKLTYLFVAHDLAVVRYICSRVVVMYLGKVVELSGVAPLFCKPLHPYTKALMSAVPDVERGLRNRNGDHGRIVLEGDVPSPAEQIPGCPFHTRCPFSQSRCVEEVPELREARAGHFVSCHFADDLSIL
jgi:oligopeptide transport system ATP-binding protein